MHLPTLRSGAQTTADEFPGSQSQTFTRQTSLSLANISCLLKDETYLHCANEIIHFSPSKGGSEEKEITTCHSFVTICLSVNIYVQNPIY